MTHTFHVTVTTDDLNVYRHSAQQIASEILSHLDYEKHMVGITSVAVDVNAGFDAREWPEGCVCGN